MRDVDLEREKLFENAKNSGEGVRQAQSKFYWAVELSSKKHHEKVMHEIRNKRVLEIGCSNGSAAAEYAESSRYYLGVDISDLAIEIAKERNLPNAEFVCTDGHHLPADDQTYDIVIVNSLLHHLDLQQAFTEINRVLVPRGGLIFREPLGTNPLFQLYRLLTPSARTPDEKPFDFSDLKLMQSYFQLKDHDFYGFSNLLSAFVRNQRLRSVLTVVDRILARTPLKYFYWQFAGIAKKLN